MRAEEVRGLIVGDILKLTFCGNRFGQDINHKDQLGFCPLHLALREVLECVRTPPWSWCCALSPQDRADHRDRTKLGITYLIEHGADVNYSVDGIRPLHFACLLGDMDLVEQLLKYGANASPEGVEPPSVLLASAALRAQFSE